MGKNRFVIGNASALEQIFTNLLKNAINYTPENKDGKVTITLESDYQGRVVAAIVDNGIGIAQKDLYRIFEPFYRADTSRTRGIGRGTSGLGLAIVNEIVRLHRGSISIKSGVGMGTTVAVTLPPAPNSALQPEQVISETNEGVNEVNVDFS
jgi:signal transduction histidine kinase